MTDRAMQRNRKRDRVPRMERLSVALERTSSSLISISSNKEVKPSLEATITSSSAAPLTLSQNETFALSWRRRVFTVGGQVGKRGGGKALDLRVVVLVKGQQLLEACVFSQKDFFLICADEQSGRC